MASICERSNSSLALRDFLARSTSCIIPSYCSLLEKLTKIKGGRNGSERGQVQNRVIRYLREEINFR